MRRLVALVLGLLLCLLLGCAAENPVEALQRELAGYPEYTVILNDYTEEGNFFPDYQHQYRVVVGEPQADGTLSYRDDLRDFVSVSEDFYREYEPYLGMAILAKTPDGDVTTTPFPPGYQYVGDPQYGSWEEGENGDTFWRFAGQYLLLSSVFNTLGRAPVSRSDWGGYTTANRGGQPYFGGGRYGTEGTLTRQTNPTFFERQRARQAVSRQNFNTRVQERVGRSNGSSTRSRSRGFGGK